MSKKQTVVVKTKEELLKIIKSSRINVNLNYLDVSSITDMSGLFADSEFKGNISKWDVSNVINMKYIFKNS